MNTNRLHLDHDEQNQPVVTACGDLVYQTAEEFRSFTERALTESPAHLKLDPSQVTFIDSAGITVIFAAARRLENGSRLLIANAPSDVLRMLEIAGVPLLECVRFVDGSTTSVPLPSEST